ncbi:MAG: hypothetical protein FWC69_03465 [Defluviitaleaceae bacterium]|nr:hypothetical protein [Defluviitaleaceae bacterium]
MKFIKNVAFLTVIFTIMLLVLSSCGNDRGLEGNWQMIESLTFINSELHRDDTPRLKSNPTYLRFYEDGTAMEVVSPYSPIKLTWEVLDNYTLTLTSQSSGISHEWQFELLGDILFLTRRFGAWESSYFTVVETFIRAR